MRTRNWFVLGVAAGIAVTAIAGIPRLKKRTGCGDYVPVVVLAVDVPAGTPITFDMISQRSIPESLSTASVVKPDSASFVLNQRLLVDLKAGDMLRWGDFGVDRLAVAPKTRAFTIALPPERMVSGQLSRTDHVDVLVALIDPQTHEQVARTLIQDVTVLGVTPAGAILEVTEEEAEALLLAQHVGTFALALRGPQDTSMVDAAGRTTLATLMAGGRAIPDCGKRQTTAQIIRSGPQ